MTHLFCNENYFEKLKKNVSTKYVFDKKVLQMIS